MFFIHFLFLFYFVALTLKPKGILHIGNETQTNIKLFKYNIPNWEKLKSVKVKRLKRAKKASIWDSVTYNIPEVFQINDSYHSACYRKYTAYNASENIIETTMTSV